MNKNVKQPKEYIDENNNNLWDFVVFDDVHFNNANHIHPLKQREINIIVDKVKNDAHILGLIVFGSATEFRCNSRSDIDIFVVRDDEVIDIDADIYNMDSELDILYSQNAGSKLLDVIKKQGVLVYERG